jgi:hypothetical protein
MDWALFRMVSVRSHAGRGVGNEDHADAGQISISVTGKGGRLVSRVTVKSGTLVDNPKNDHALSVRHHFVGGGPTGQAFVYLVASCFAGEGDIANVSQSSSPERGWTPRVPCRLSNSRSLVNRP